MLWNVMEYFTDNTDQLVGDSRLTIQYCTWYPTVMVKADQEAAIIKGFQVTNFPIGIWAEGN
jgi:hypothetical protein